MFFAANAWRGGWQHCKAAIESVQFHSIDLDFDFWILNFRFWILDLNCGFWTCNNFFVCVQCIVRSMATLQNSNRVGTVSQHCLRLWLLDVEFWMLNFEFNFWILDLQLGLQHLFFLCFFAANAWRRGWQQCKALL